MTTLETLIKDTSVGQYVAIFYAIILIVASSITFVVQDNLADEQQQKINKQVAETYGLSETSSENLICYQGVLHYKNVHHLSGLLAFSPNIQCTVDELKSLQDNPHDSVADWSLTILLVGFLTLFFAYANALKVD